MIMLNDATLTRAATTETATAKPEVALAGALPSTPALNRELPVIITRRVADDTIVTAFRNTATGMAFETEPQRVVPPASQGEREAAKVVLVNFSKDTDSGRFQINFRQAGTEPKGPERWSAAHNTVPRTDRLPGLSLSSSEPTEYGEAQINAVPNRCCGVRGNNLAA